MCIDKRSSIQRSEMLTKARPPGASSFDVPKSSAARNQLALYRDVLDAILKSGAAALPVPAVLIYSCLRVIGHTELFAPSVLSLAGLSAFLQAFLLFWFAFVICVIAPSGMIYMFLGGTSGKRPSRGLPRFVLLSSFIWAAFYTIAFELWDNELTGLQYWLVIAASLVAGVALLAGLAWKSPPSIVVIPHERYESRYLHWPDSWVMRAGKNAMTAKLVSIMRRRRLWQCVGVTTVIVLSGFYSLQAILTVYSFSGASPLPQHGWRASVTLCAIILASLWPASVYLKARVLGQSHGSAVTIALAFISAVAVVAVINGFSVLPFAFGTMRAMGIIDNTPRTYQIMKSDERPLYQALGYEPKAGNRFVQAFVRFQFADVKLICPKKYDFANHPSRAVTQRSVTSTTNSTLPTVAADEARRSDSAGCLTPTKDEIRIVDLPNEFRDPLASSSAPPPSKP